MSAYYNEIDPQKAAWLRELINRGMIAPGEVDERSIRDVQPGDVAGFKQCHWFAGIGIWSYALRLAGWSDSQEVWTGSCPCQPFSAAGKGEAFDDERHLWPEFFRLIEARRPVVCFGEQVASIDGLAWLDLVQSDMDGAGYTCGAVDLCAAGVGAPHRRQRLYWVADSLRSERGPRAASGWGDERSDRAGERGEVEFLDNAIRFRWCEGRRANGGDERVLSDATGEDGHICGAVNGFWAGADWVLTRPQRVGDRPGLRPVEGRSQQMVDGTTEGVGRSGDSGFPLAQKAEARVARLRGYGDGIVAPVAVAFIRAYMETKGER